MKSSTHKYDNKTSNCEKRKVQIQDSGNAFAIKRPIFNNLVYIQTPISKPQGNHKPKKIDNTHTNEKKQFKHNVKDSHQTTREQKKERKKTNKNKSKTINKVAIRTYISIITLNVNGPNAPTKRYRLA